MRPAAVAIALTLLAGCGGSTRGAPRGAEALTMRPAPSNVERRCDEVARETAIPVRCPVDLPGNGPWHVEHRNFGSGDAEYLMDLAAFDARGPFHLLVGGRSRRWELELDEGSAWPDEGLRLIAETPPTVVGAARVAGRPGLLVRVPPHPRGGLHGDHLVVVWNQGGGGHVVSLHVERPHRGDERQWLLATAESMARRGAVR